MGERYLLGIDVGTSSLKVAVVCENGEVLNISSCSYVPSLRSHHPPTS